MNSDGRVIICAKCNEEKEHRAHGLCKRCYERRWHEENPDYRRHYYQEHKEERAAYNRRYREKNRERLLARERQYREENKGRLYERRRLVTTRFSSAKSWAKRRGHDWQLTKNEYAGLIARPCYYCGGDLPEVGAGLDRRDNSLGYLLDNVVSCCWLCNTIKNNRLTETETQMIGRVLRTIRENRIVQGFPTDFNQRG